MDRQECMSYEKIATLLRVHKVGHFAPRESRANTGIRPYCFVQAGRLYHPKEETFKRQDKSYPTKEADLEVDATKKNGRIAIRPYRKVCTSGGAHYYRKGRSMAAPLQWTDRNVFPTKRSPRLIDSTRLLPPKSGRIAIRPYPKVCTSGDAHY